MDKTWPPDLEAAPEKPTFKPRCDPYKDDCPGDDNWFRGYSPEFARKQKAERGFKECDIDYVPNKKDCFEDEWGFFWYYPVPMGEQMPNPARKVFVASRLSNN